MRILVDSGSDLTLQEIEQHNLDFLPMSVAIGDKSYKDQLEIDNQTVYEAIQQGRRPMTSQVSIDQLTELFTEIAGKGEQAIYYAFSSALSGTYQSAVMVKEQVTERFPDFDIEIIDSRSASRGLGMQILDIVSLRDQGMTKDEIVTQIHEMHEAIVHLFTVEDLAYLAKGGRLSKSQAVLGSLINIKPLLTVEEGQLVPVGKYRGRKKVFKEMAAQLKKDGHGAVINISHSNDETGARQLADLIAQECGGTIHIHELGPTIASHTGQGTIAMYYFKEGHS
ncbi:DegV family protein [Macrococcus equipercicus]|uniref:DegV family protein n=1 Tax=Macrococcus equipercicus TaxID=69967 RepID=A0ABQ6RBF1_9STAP|nr:DegV family protein [Macrococcus equipercicus]KAA1042577.1 DegV family protein [Macrococcus equipercicus]